MSVINVLGNIQIDSENIQDKIETFSTGDKRSAIDLRLTSNSVSMLKSSAVTKFVVPFKYEENKNNKNYYQRLNSFELVSGDSKILLSLKNSRPMISRKLVNSTFDLVKDYEILYSSSADSYKVVENTNTFQITTNKKVIFLLVSSSGGGGRGSRSWHKSNFWRGWTLGGSGGSGSWALFEVNLENLEKIKIFKSLGGAGTSWDKNGEDGQNTKIQVFNKDKTTMTMLLDSGKGGKTVLDRTGEDDTTENSATKNRNSEKNGGMGAKILSIGKNDNIRLVQSGNGKKSTYNIDVKLKSEFNEPNDYTEVKTNTGSSKICFGGSASIFSNGVDSPSDWESNGLDGTHGGGGTGATCKYIHAFAWWDDYKKGGNGGNGAFQILY